MHFVAWRGLADEYRKATDGHSPWKPDEKNAVPICYNDIDSADLSDSLRAVIKSEGIGGLAFIPLISSGNLIGKFMVYFNAPHEFSEAELDLSLTIARQLASAVDRKRAEEALRRNEEMFSTLVDAAPFGVYFIDSRISFARRSTKVRKRCSAASTHSWDVTLPRSCTLSGRNRSRRKPLSAFGIPSAQASLLFRQPVIEERANIDEIQAYDWQIHRITLSGWNIRRGLLFL